MNKQSVSMLIDFIGVLEKPLRYGATVWNPSFYLSNMQADAQQAAIYSDKPFIPLIDNVRGIVNYASTYDRGAGKIAERFNAEYAEEQRRMLQLYNQSGASSATRLAQERKSIQKTMTDVYGVKNSEVLGIEDRWKGVKKVTNILNTAGEVTEQSTRFEVFKKNYENYVEQGWSELDVRLQSALEARDATQDFSRMGRVMREVNKLIPFSSARVGSNLTFYEKVKGHPYRTISRMAILAVFGLTIKTLFGDDDEIEEINQRKKDDYYIFKIGDTIFTIKKPQGILKSWLNLNELIFDIVTGKVGADKIDDRIWDWTSNTLKDASISDDITGFAPSFFTTLMENAMNKDFYYNSDIVKSWDLDLPEEQQYYDYNSQIAIALGQVFHYSPAKIDNLISGWFGGLGTDITNLWDWISGKLGLSVEEPAMGAEDTPVLKRIVINPSENSASVDEIYKREEELTKKQNGGTITEKEIEELENIKNGISKLSALNKQIKAIKQDLTMSGEEKAKQIRPLQEQKVDVARQALGKEPIYTENTDNLDSLEFYPSRSTLSYNGLTLELTEEMKQEYEDLAYNLYKKYEKQGLYSDEYLDKIKSKCKETAKKQLMQKYRSRLTK